MIVGAISLPTTHAQVSAQSQASLIAQLGLQIQALQAQLAQLTGSAQVNGSGSASAGLGQALSVALRQGSKGEDVKILQAILAADASVYPQGLITGFFGSLTANAVARFQAKFGISGETGIGAATLAKLNAEADSSLDIDVDANGNTRPCAIVPPGHLIAPGWLRVKADGTQIVPACQTLPPGIAAQLSGSLSLSGVVAVNVGSNSATVDWTTNVAATSKVFYSANAPVNMTTAATVSDNALVTAHVISLTGLTANTTYYFVVESRDASGVVMDSAQGSFTTSVSGSVNPIVSSVTASGVSSTTATINFSTNETTTARVFYSTVTPVNVSASASATDSVSATTHSVVLANLSANTTYYFVIQATDASGSVTLSASYSVMTSASGSVNPVISGVATGSVTASTATVNWSTNVAATGRVFYSTTSPVNTSTSASVSASGSASSQSVTLTGLSANTTYYFVIQATDASGNVATSVNYSLMTSVSGTSPVISSVSIVAAANGAVVTWTTNVAATSRVYYSTTTPVNTASAQFTASADMTVSHSITLSGLSANALYYLVIQSQDGSGNVSTSGEFQVTTH